MTTLTFSGTSGAIYTPSAPYQLSSISATCGYSSSGLGVLPWQPWTYGQVLSSSAISNGHEISVSLVRSSVESVESVGALFLSLDGSVGVSLEIKGTTLTLKDVTANSVISSTTVSNGVGTHTLTLRVLNLTTGALYCAFNGTEYFSGSAYTGTKTDLHYGWGMWREGGAALSVDSVADATLSSSTLDTLSTPVNVGGTGYTGTTTGLGTASSLTFAGKSAAITGTGSGTLTFSMPTFVHGVTYPAVGVQTFTVGDGTLTATKTSTVGSLSGYTPVTMATLDRGEFSIGKDTNIVTGDVVHLPTAGGTLNTDGTLTDYVFGAYTMWRRDVSDGKMYSSTLTVSESGVGGGGTTGLTSIKITSSGLTSSGLTAI